MPSCSRSAPTTTAERPAEDARRASTGDLDTIAGLFGEAVSALESARGGDLYLASLPSGIDGPAVLADFQSRADWAVFAGCYEGACVGAALAHIEQLIGDHGTYRVARVLLLYVEQGAREVGVGRRLVDEIASWAAGSGCSGVDVPALPGDRLTKSLLEGAGHRARLVVMHRPLAAPPDR